MLTNVLCLNVQDFLSKIQVCTWKTVCVHGDIVPRNIPWKEGRIVNWKCAGCQLDKFEMEFWERFLAPNLVGSVNKTVA